MNVVLSIRRKDKAPLNLPQHYNNIIQAFIYKNIDSELSKFLHDKGYEANKRRFKMFTFSNLHGRYSIDKTSNNISFIDGVTLTISSPLEKFTTSIVNAMLVKEDLFLNKQHIEIESVEIKNNRTENENVKLDIISPIVVYSTILKEDGKKFTYYHRPLDAGYDELITENLRKKYEALHNEKITSTEIVRMEPVGNLKFRLSKYKEFIIKGYTGKIIVTGSKELINMGIECGFGSKNSQGFGCVRKI